MHHDIRVPLKVCVDEREQTPWAWEACDVTPRMVSLVSGDYALESDTEAVRGRKMLAVRFSIERKEYNDFLSSISSNWDRFQRELTRMENFPAKIVIVEGDFERCCFHARATPDQFGGMIDPPQHSHPALQPTFVARRIAELSMMGVCVLLAGKPEYAAALAYRIFLRRAELEQQKGESK